MKDIALMLFILAVSLIGVWFIGSGCASVNIDPVTSSKPTPPLVVSDPIHMILNDSTESELEVDVVKPTRVMLYMLLAVIVLSFMSYTPVLYTTLKTKISSVLRRY